MPYDLTGCMELNGGRWRPVWESPCGGASMYGCMDLVGGKHAPKFNGGFGACTEDKTGCMELNAGKHRPVLTYDDYANLAALRAACCPNCTHCFGEFEAPAFIKITFVDVIVCEKNPPFDPHGIVPGGEYILPWFDDQGATVCKWILDEGAGDGTFYIAVILAIVSSVLVITIQASSYEDVFLYLMYDYYRHGWSCTDEGPFTNDQVIAHCNILPHQAHTFGYDGTATIDWSP